MGEWTKEMLGSYMEFRNGKTSPNRSETGAFIVFGSNGAIGRASEANADSDTIIVGRVGTYCGSLHYSSSPCWVTDNAIICTPHKNEKRFWFYVLLSLNLNNYRAGSGQPLLNQNILKQISFCVPTAAERLQIGAFVGTLDDKIDLNCQMNETLEAMARAIFKDWFVDFGPTRAKIEGREPYLAPELWNLFPDALDEENKPVGWQPSEIGKEVEAFGGATPSTKEPSYWEGGEKHWATPKDLSKLVSPVLLDTDRKITDTAVNKISSGLLPIGTVLLSSRAPIGYLAIAEVQTAVNQGFIAMVCEKRLPNVFVLFWCYENLDYIKGISGGSTFAEISKKVFRHVPVIVPSQQVLTAYEGIVRPLYDRIGANTKESASLARTRDLLLPKLMSGEIRLAGVENTSDEAP